MKSIQESLCNPASTQTLMTNEYGKFSESGNSFHRCYFHPLISLNLDFSCKLKVLVDLRIENVEKESFGISV